MCIVCVVSVALAFHIECAKARAGGKQDYDCVRSCTMECQANTPLGLVQGALFVTDVVVHNAHCDIRL